MTEMDWLDIFGDNLADLMREKGYTQRDLADSTGLSESAISQYLSKKRIPTVRALINICYELDCDWYDILDFGERID